MINLASWYLCPSVHFFSLKFVLCHPSAAFSHSERKNRSHWTSLNREFLLQTSAESRSTEDVTDLRDLWGFIRKVTSALWLLREEVFRVHTSGSGRREVVSSAKLMFATQANSRQGGKRVSTHKHKTCHWAGTCFTVYTNNSLKSPKVRGFSGELRTRVQSFSFSVFILLKCSQFVFQIFVFVLKVTDSIRGLKSWSTKKKKNYQKTVLFILTGSSPCFGWIWAQTFIFYASEG